VATKIKKHHSKQEFIVSDFSKQGPKSGYFDILNAEASPPSSPPSIASQEDQFQSSQAGIKIRIKEGRREGAALQQRTQRIQRTKLIAVSYRLSSAYGWIVEIQVVTHLTLGSSCRVSIFSAAQFR